MTHKQWLDNEYKQWVEALKECRVEDFGRHPMVKRMMGETVPIYNTEWINSLTLDTVCDIGNGDWAGVVSRMVYYADQVLKNKPKKIVEIGGGVGQFYAVLRALGYCGEYAMYDLPEVLDFQLKYLAEFEKRTGLKCPIVEHDKKDNDWFCVSFYAFGEFTDETKDWYINNVINHCEHGMIAFNPHNGASDKINFKCKIEDEHPLTSPGNKVLTW